MKDEKSSMAALIAAMGDGDLGAPSSSAPVRSNSSMPSVDPITGQPLEFFGEADLPPEAVVGMDPMSAPRVPTSSEDNEAMARILRAFKESGGEDASHLGAAIEKTSAVLMEDMETMPELVRAMATKRTSTGVQVGGWEIVTEKKDRFNVVSVASGQLIAKDLYIYEAAEALVRMLNEGLMINNMKMQSILLLEMDYAKHIEDAIQHKHAVSRALDRGDDHRLELSRVRFNEAKTKALAARKKLTEHLKR